MFALNHMDKSKGGRGGTIVNISSVAGIEPLGMIAIYSAAKHGIAAFSRAMAVNLNKFYFIFKKKNCSIFCRIPFIFIILKLIL